jgi:hypothetical protein
MIRPVVEVQRIASEAADERYRDITTVALILYNLDRHVIEVDSPGSRFRAPPCRHRYLLVPCRL